MIRRKQEIENLIGATLAFYNKLGGGDPADAETTYVDLLADLMLVAAGEGVDFERALTGARRHFDVEISDADDDSHLAQYDDDPNPYSGTYSEE